VRVVLDANVWVSGLLYPDGTSGRILESVRQGAITAVASWALADEVAEVLRRPRITKPYGIDEADVRAILELMRPLLPTVEVQVAIRDADDAPVVAAALAGGAEAIVSGDKDLFDPALRAWLADRHVRVLTPREVAEGRRDIYGR